MLTFPLSFDQQNEMFVGTFKEVPKEFIGFLKEQGFLEKVTDECIESLPDVMEMEINIDPAANPEDSYWVFFYTETKATEEMKIPTQEYLNRDLDIDEDDETIQFNILIPKDSKIIKKSDDQEIIIEF